MGEERVREGQDRENIDVHGRRGETEGGGGCTLDMQRERN